MSQRRNPERGVALIIVLLVMLTLSALALALALLTSTETRVAAAYRDGLEVLYATDAAVERAIRDLAMERDIDSVLSGLTTSSFIDGPPGSRMLPDGTSTDLHSLTAMVSCGSTVCSDDDLDAEGDDRPWGPNNPRWRLYAYGSVEAWASGPIRVPKVYQVVWVADDPSETDGDPMRDGGGVEGTENPGRGRVSLLAHGYGRTGTRRIVEATVMLDDDGARLVSWREAR
jgi:hypothetical protein